MKRTVLVCLLLAGCSTVGNVKTIGVDTYMVGSRAGGFHSWSEIKELAINRASEHCANFGNKMQVLNIQTHGARGWTPLEAEVTFKCI